MRRSAGQMRKSAGPLGKTRDGSQGTVEVAAASPVVPVRLIALAAAAAVVAAAANLRGRSMVLHLTILFSNVLTSLPPRLTRTKFLM